MYRTDSASPGGVKSPLEEGQDHKNWALSPWSRAIKRTMDVAGASLFLIVFLPMFLAVAAGVRLSSPGTIFYVQTRAGRGGRNFQFYKFRSMQMDSEEVLSSFLDSDSAAKQKWEQFQKVDNDPRITRFGQFIRRTSLDELPQFWNVLKGDMSLVGPRPCMLKQRELYGRHWPAYCAVKPGITGLWQVSGRNKLTYQKRVALDAEYVKFWSVWADFRILAQTVGVVLRAQGAH
jgi:exopolysaccharide production protein ExoY